MSKWTKLIIYLTKLKLLKSYFNRHDPLLFKISLLTSIYTKCSYVRHTSSPVLTDCKRFARRLRDDLDSTVMFSCKRNIASLSPFLFYLIYLFIYSFFSYFIPSKIQSDSFFAKLYFLLLRSYVLSLRNRRRGNFKRQRCESTEAWWEWWRM